MHAGEESIHARLLEGIGSLEGQQRVTPRDWQRVYSQSKGKHLNREFLDQFLLEREASPEHYRNPLDSATRDVSTASPAVQNESEEWHKSLARQRLAHPKKVSPLVAGIIKHNRREAARTALWRDQESGEVNNRHDPATGNLFNAVRDEALEVDHGDAAMETCLADRSEEELCLALTAQYESLLEKTLNHSVLYEKELNQALQKASEAKRAFQEATDAADQTAADAKSELDMGAGALERHVAACAVMHTPLDLEGDLEGGALEEGEEVESDALTLRQRAVARAERDHRNHNSAHTAALVAKAHQELNAAGEGEEEGEEAARGAAGGSGGGRERSGSTRAMLIAHADRVLEPVRKFRKHDLRGHEQDADGLDFDLLSTAEEGVEQRATSPVTQNLKRLRGVQAKREYQSILDGNTALALEWERRIGQAYHRAARFEREHQLAAAMSDIISEEASEVLESSHARLDALHLAIQEASHPTEPNINYYHIWTVFLK